MERVGSIFPLYNLPTKPISITSPSIFFIKTTKRVNPLHNCNWEIEKENERAKMVVEDTPKSIITDDQITANPNRVIEDDNNLEEGEILDEDDSSATSKPVVHQPHPLENSWTFWFDTPAAKSKQAAWGSSMRPIYTFSTVEEFWSIYNNIHHPSKLAVGADFYCFKHKIEPKWEDPICANGGKWTANYQKGKSDTSWLYTLLAMIGEQFDHGDEICGAVVNVRGRAEKISIWTKNASNEAAQVSIGKQWKEFLDYNETMGFIFHDDARKHDRNAKNKYVV